MHSARSLYLPAVEVSHQPAGVLMVNSDGQKHLLAAHPTTHQLEDDSGKRIDVSCVYAPTVNASHQPAHSTHSYSSVKNRQPLCTNLAGVTHGTHLAGVTRWSHWRGRLVGVGCVCTPSFKSCRKHQTLHPKPDILDPQPYAGESERGARHIPPLFSIFLNGFLRDLISPLTHKEGNRGGG